MIGAIDIGGTKIAVGIVNNEGEVIKKSSFPTEAHLGPEQSLQRIINWLEATTQGENLTIEGVGIGSTGPVYPMLGEIGVLEFLPGWDGFNIVGYISSALNANVALENDADAAALGEWAWGSGRNVHCFILVTVGTGIGVGIVLNNALYRGVDGSHPEIGHHFIDPQGPSCSCGGQGCWESLASGSALERWAQEHDPGGVYLSAQVLCQKADKGNLFALSAIQRTAKYLSIGIANLVTMFCPDVITVSGGLMASSHLFSPQIVSATSQYCKYVPAERTNIEVIHPNRDIGLRGAAQVFIQHKGKN